MESSYLNGRENIPKLLKFLFFYLFSFSANLNTELEIV